MNQTNSFKNRINSMRKSMAANGLDAYVIPVTDPHMSEYLPAHWRTLEWASGFTGSAGTLVFTQNFAGLWTDSRYFIQAEQQLEGSGIELVKLLIPHTPEFIEWLRDSLAPGSKVGLDGSLMSRSLFELLESNLKGKSIEVRANIDLVSEFWTNRPELPTEAIFEHPSKFVGQTRSEKLEAVRSMMKKQEADYLVLSSLDDIAWLFNLRGSDVPYNPLFVAHALIGQEDAQLFIDPSKVSDTIRRKLSRDGVKTHDYTESELFLSKLPNTSKILIDPRRVSQNLPGAFPEGASILYGINPTTLLKSCKTETEANHTRQTMIKDGVVLTKFFYWLTHTIGKEKITECSATEKLHELRKAQKDNVGESFGTISAYGPHGAMPHYSATPESDLEILQKSLYLLDSGGQYLGGTTDTTRVMSMGEITEEEKVDYTLVLKGLIAVCTMRFPVGTKGWQLDALARAPLWMNGINYGHGTGHGVGYFLNVHEGPQNISPTMNASAGMGAALQPGMITSVEPGIYRTGKHGIRLENLVLCVEDETTEFGSFLAFEVLTLAPLFTNLVQKSMLSKAELQWLKSYNSLVLRKIGKYLTPEEKAWAKAESKI
ncbi:MAG: aminopeptidase P family protein [Saprospiraceae bacterium]